MDVFIGTVLPMAINFVPRGWMSCEGQILNVAQNQALFSLITNKYGGNGTTTFALPDLRGRSIVGTGPMPGGSNYVLGQFSGATSVTLTTNNLPSHTHSVVIKANSLGANTSEPTGAYIGGGSVNMFTNQAPDVSMNAAGATATATGGNQPVGILNPYLCTYYNIATTGLYPQRP